MTLSEIRNKMALSQNELADRAAIDRKTYVRVEKGEIKNPQARTIRGLAKALEMSTESVRAMLSRAAANTGAGEDLLSPLSDENAVFDQKESLSPIGDPFSFREEPAEYGFALNGASDHEARATPINLEAYFKDHGECEDIFRTIARQSAICETKMFNSVYRDLRRLDPIQQAALHHTHLRHAKTVIMDNFDEVLGATSRLFKILHKGSFAACLQLLNVDVSGARFVTTLLHDPDCEARVEDRAEDVPHNVEGNSLSHEIYVEKKGFAFCNDLRAAIAERVVMTTSARAGVVYNAVLISAIPRLGDGSRSPIASLCLDTPTCFDLTRLSVSKHFLSEIGWRIAALLYRLELIQEELKI